MLCVVMVFFSFSFKIILKMTIKTKREYLQKNILVAISMKVAIAFSLQKVLLKIINKQLYFCYKYIYYFATGIYETLSIHVRYQFDLISRVIPISINIKFTNRTISFPLFFSFPACAVGYP